LPQPFPERGEARLALGIIGGEIYEHADAPHPLALLRARAASGQAAALPRNVMNARRFMSTIVPRRPPSPPLC
jgi:hypothetical protein